jgi:hypothetical protein
VASTIASKIGILIAVGAINKLLLTKIREGSGGAGKVTFQRGDS